MKPATDELNTHMLTQTRTFAFDLYTFSLSNGAVYQWTDSDTPITTTDARRFVLGPAIQRDRVTWVRGITVDELQVTLMGAAPFSINGVSLAAFAVAGGFDSAKVLLERAYLDDALKVKGQMHWFSGTVADITDITQTSVPIQIKSDLQNLDVMMPRNLYQAPCRNDLYDVRCTVNRAQYTVNASVNGVDPRYARVYLQTAYYGKPPGWFSLGIVTFLTGQNAGLSRTVKSHDIGPDYSSLLLARPLPFPIAINDTFAVSAGCDKTMTTCRDKFDDVIRFRGEPFIPNPEVAT